MSSASFDAGKCGVFLAVATTGALLACWGAGTPAAAGAAPGIVLYEVHTQSQVPQADTIVTYVTARRVRISHAGGHTLLDLDADRIAFLDPKTGTVRGMSLRQWEARLRQAVAGSAVAGGDPAAAAGDSGAAAAGDPAAVDSAGVEGFEPTGTSAEIAGTTCDRYHHYGRAAMLGSEEMVEKQIWVARELPMPVGAYEAYQRALESIESIGAGVLRRRPRGVILAVETHTQRAGAGRDVPLDIERTTVFRIERRTLADSLFAIPGRYVPAAEGEPGGPEMH
jgi:hypothetical protein